MTSSNSNLFFRTNRPTREFQDDSDGASSVPRAAQNQVSTLQSTSCVLQQYMMAAMVEVICSLIENGDPTKTERLYKKVYQQLRRWKIMLPITTINEFAMVRHQFKNSFHALITRIRRDLQRETRSRFHPSTLAERVESIFFQPRLDHNLPALPAVDTIIFPHRYRDEYNQIKRIGKGAYGAVYKVKHKLDGSMYAMKLVEFSPKAGRIQKVTREARNLSNLSHRNVVRYYGAWIENDFSPLMCSDERRDVIQQESEEGNMPALEDPGALQYLRQPEGLDIDKVQRDDISGDSVIRFVSSTPGQKLDASINPTHRSVGQQSANGSSEQPHSWASLNESMPEYPHDNQIITQMCSTLYIQMELCESNLKDWLTDRNDRHSKKECEVSEQDNMNILKQILKAVEYIHSKNLIHRDLKPHNIFINTNSQTMEIKLGDFGLSRHIQTSNPLADEAVSGVSSTSARASPELTPHPGITDGFDWTLKTQGVGTMIYAAPEQLEGNDYNNKSDMYSLGLIAYELYCPFHTETERRICLKNARIQGLPKDFQDLWPTESQFIQKLLSQHHTDRPSAKDLLSSALFLTTDQIIQNLCSEQDKLKAENFSLRQKLEKQSEEIERKDSENDRLRLENLILQETVKELQQRN